jgi:nucleoside-diphosphate-sugar epimerase
MKGARYVFHCAFGRDGRDAARITVEGTRNVVEAAIAAGAESIVVLSTATVFGHPSARGPVDESWPYRPALGEYGRSKMRAERDCLHRARSSPVTRVVVLNPTAVYGPGSKNFAEMPARMARDGGFCWIEDGRGLVNYTFVENLVDAMLLAAVCPEAHGKRFIINDGVCTWKEFLTPLLAPWMDSLPSYTREELNALERASRPKWRDLLRAMATDEAMAVINRMPVLGAPKRFIATRWPALYERLQRSRRKQATAAVVACPEKKSGMPPVWLADLFGPTATVFSSEKACEVLRWKPLVTLEEGQKRAAKWLGYMRILPP